MNKNQLIWPAVLLVTSIPWVLALAGSPWARPAPALVALALVFLLRQPFPALLLGAFSGVLALTPHEPWMALSRLLDQHMLTALTSKWNLCAILFTLLAGGLASILEHGGGFTGWLSRLAGKSGAVRPRLVQGWAFVFGLACFFDGLANAMLAGRIFRPFFDRARVPRAVLAWIVDSTSAPVACIAFVSTWIAFQLGLIREGFAAVGIQVSPYTVYAASVPANYYCWFALLLVALSIYKNWRPGAMGRAQPSLLGDLDTQPTRTCGIWRAGVPLAVLIGSMLIGLYLSGAGWTAPASWAAVADAFGTADAALVLLTASVLAVLTAWALHPRPAQAGSALTSGVSAFVPPVCILIAAWTLGSVLKALQAPAWIAAWLDGALPLAYLPAVVFTLAALTSFCTGTSWGTMGVMMPLALPAALTMALSGGLGPGGSLTIGAAITAAVFSGAVFGDHCSPLSDTTIVSAAAAGCDPIEHVRTQMPYALIAAVTALLLGFLPLGWGAPPWLGLLIGAVALVVVVWRCPPLKSCAED